MSVEMVRFRADGFDDSGEFGRVTGRGAGGERLDLYRPQQDGISTAPKKGAMGVALFDRSRENGVVIALESPGDRPKGQEEGGKTVYGPNGQAYVMKPDGTILMKAAQGDQVIAPKAGGGKVYLGGDPADGGSFAKVVTESGPSPFVWARYA